MRTPFLRSHLWFAKLPTRCPDNAANAKVLPRCRNFSRQSETVTARVITVQSRQKHRQYLGKLLLSPPPAISNRILYYKAVHAQVILSGFESNVFLNNVLITTYAKGLGALQTAVNLFDKMLERSLVSWSSMISAYNQNGYNAEALTLFREFRRSCSDCPNEFILATVIQSCTELRSIDNGMYIHGFVMKAGYDQNAHVGTSLIDFYAKASDLDAAMLVFDDLGRKTVATWTAVMMGFAINGISDASLHLFKEMIEMGIVPDTYALSCVLRVCSMLELLGLGKQVHAFVLRNGANTDVSVGNALVDFYSKCGDPKAGLRTFNWMVVKNVLSWATMISVYMQNGCHYEAMDLYEDMIRLGWKTDGFACASVLASSGSVGMQDLGKQVHAHTIKVNLDSDEFVTNSLIDMYCKCNSLTDARRVFLGSAKCSAVCYNAMIEGYSRQERLHEALDLFHEMRRNLISPSQLTFLSLLGASASCLAMEVSWQLHTLTISLGFSVDSYVGSALIDVYSKCSSAGDARLVFEGINEKDIVIWNSMLFGYALQSESEKAHRLYSEFLHQGHKPNQYTLVAIIMASSNQTSLSHGLQLYSQAVRLGLDSDPFITNTLMDMYAKYGITDVAQSVFNSLVQKDTACWNSIISMYAKHGDAEQALQMFKQMKADGIQPDYVTFVVVLSACAHVGLVEEGFLHFSSMLESWIEPGEEHYSCMVALLGRAGKLDQARTFIYNMPIQPTATVWKSLLSACRVNSNIELGQHAAEMAMQSDPTDSGSYILLSNIFASKGMWRDVKEVRTKMDSNAVVKETAGCSWIEVNNQVEHFAQD